MTGVGVLPQLYHPLNIILHQQPSPLHNESANAHIAGLFCAYNMFPDSWAPLWRGITYALYGPVALWAHCGLFVTVYDYDSVDIKSISRAIDFYLSFQWSWTPLPLYLGFLWATSKN